MEVHVNAAMSVDGKLSTHHRDQVAISGPRDFDRVDDLRSGHDAILVGIGTVLADDPHLTTDDDRNPTRVVVDTTARIPLDAAVLDDTAPSIVVAGDTASQDRVTALESVEATVVVAGSDRVDLQAALSTLETEGIESVLVEGGGDIIFSLFDADLVDTLTVYVGSIIIGGENAPTLADGDGFDTPATFPKLSLQSVERLDDGVFLTYTTE